MEAEVLAGEIVPIDDEYEESNDSYEVSVNLRKMTWGHNMIHVRFQLLTETIGDTSDDADPKVRMAALKELLEGFDDLTAYLNRVAKVKRNGVRIHIKDVPQAFIPEVMASIGAAQKSNRTAKN
jgi:hypothetical protein